MNFVVTSAENISIVTEVCVHKHCVSTAVLIRHVNS